MQSQHHHKQQQLQEETEEEEANKHDDGAIKITRLAENMTDRNHRVDDDHGDEDGQLTRDGSHHVRSTCHREYPLAGDGSASVALARDGIQLTRNSPQVAKMATPSAPRSGSNTRNSRKTAAGARAQELVAAKFAGMRTAAEAKGAAAAAADGSDSGTFSPASGKGAFSFILF